MGTGGGGGLGRGMSFCANIAAMWPPCQKRLRDCADDDDGADDGAHEQRHDDSDGGDDEDGGQTSRKKQIPSATSTNRESHIDTTSVRGDEEKGERTKVMS